VKEPELAMFSITSKKGASHQKNVLIKYGTKAKSYATLGES